MTGHGWSEQACDGFNISVEVSSVNRKQAEVVATLPRELDVLESLIRAEVLRKVARGRVSVRVNLHVQVGREAGQVAINSALAKAYASELQKLVDELKLQGGVTLDTLLRAPGVLQSARELDDAESFWPPVQKALNVALDTLAAMREREGEHLLKDLSGRVDALRHAVLRIKKLVPLTQEKYRRSLLERIQAAGLDPSQADPERIAKEVVFFADRSDVSEELSRLDAHFAQFDAIVAQDVPVGRTLDFLSQEMNREINTLGAKANDSQISQDVVVLKSELEKFREQVQNVE
ncbi:MAG: YicC family protein [Verrucomicrobia bacterium]|nr:YicC family protein [Verrucomicrobiota bacterium]